MGQTVKWNTLAFANSRRPMRAEVVRAAREEMKHYRTPSALTRMFVGDDSSSGLIGSTDGVLVVADREVQRPAAYRHCDAFPAIVTAIFPYLNAVQRSSGLSKVPFSFGRKSPEIRTSQGIPERHRAYPFFDTGYQHRLPERTNNRIPQAVGGR